jgi:hypothetical protein
MRLGAALVLAAASSTYAIANADCPQPNLSPLTRFPAQSGAIQMVSDPVIGANDDGRLEVFALGSDGSLWHAWQLPEDFHKWSDWFSFGHPANVLFQPIAGQSPGPQIAVAEDHNRHLQVFVANGDLWQIGQVVTNGGWGGWQRIAQTNATAPQPAGARWPVYSINTVWATDNADGRIELFLNDRTASIAGSLTHKWQLGDFSSWSPNADPFGWPVTGNVTAQNPLALAQDARGRIVVATAGPGGAYVRRQADANSGWADWEQLGRPAGGGPSPIVSVDRNADGRLELVTSAGGTVWHTWQADASTWSGQWAIFSPVGYVVERDVKVIRTPLLTSNSVTSCLNVVNLFSAGGHEPDSEGPDQPVTFSLLALYQMKPSGSWNTWHTPPTPAPPGFTTSGRIAVARGRDGRLEIMTLGQGFMYHATQQ